MHPQPGQQFQMLSNDIEDFAQGGGLYAGGTGIVEEFSFRLWDYNGTKPKDSFCAAYLRFKPTDGSGDGKAVEQYYNVGESSEYLPDPTGGHLLSTKGKTPVNSCLWGHFLDSLRKNCGLEKGRLNGPSGIRVMERGLLTLVKVDQPKYDNQQAPPPDPTKRVFPKTTLIATRAVFSWDPNYQRAMSQPPPPPTQHVPPPQQMAPQQQYQPPQQQQYAPPPAQAAPQYANGAPAPQMAPPMPPQQGFAPPTGTANGPSDLGSVVTLLLATHNGSLSLAELPKLVLEELQTSVSREERILRSKESKDPGILAQLASQNRWTISGDDLVA